MKLRFGCVLLMTLLLFPIAGTAAERPGAAKIKSPDANAALANDTFEYPRVAARQERSAKRTPGKPHKLSCDNSCRCGFICNDFGFCNSAMSNCQVMTIPPSCDEVGCTSCACW